MWLAKTVKGVSGPAIENIENTGEWWRAGNKGTEENKVMLLKDKLQWEILGGSGRAVLWVNQDSRNPLLVSFIYCLTPGLYFDPRNTGLVRFTSHAEQPYGTVVETEEVEIWHISESFTLYCTRKEKPNLPPWQIYGVFGGYKGGNWARGMAFLDGCRLDSLQDTCPHLVVWLNVAK